MADSTKQSWTGAVITIGLYSQDVDLVWGRIDTYSRIEGAVFHKIVFTWLAEPKMMIIDVGGGNGRHAFDLAAQGHRVRLCDLTPELVADAQRRNEAAQHPLSDIRIADARDLPWPTRSADAALMLGPMYCIPDEQGRVAALRELGRVVRPGGILLVQFLSRIGGLRAVLFGAWKKAGLFDWRSYMETGHFTDSSIPLSLRASIYWHSLEQIEKEMAAAGLDMLQVYGMDGPGPEAQYLIREAPQEIIDQWADISYSISTDPATLNTNNHILVVGRVPSDAL